MPQNVYDQASRLTARLDAVGFMTWALKLLPEQFVYRGWLDTRDTPSPGEADQIGDTVAHMLNVSKHGEPWAIVVEFQSEPDPLMFGRLLGYFSGIWLNQKPDEERGSRFNLGAVVVNLTGVGTASREMTWAEAKLGTKIDAIDRNLETESAEELLDSIETGRWSRAMLPWVPLMAGANELKAVERWKRLAEAEPDSRKRSEFGLLAQIFAERAGRKDLWHKQLKEWNVEETIIGKRLIAIGEAKGEAKGRAEGEAKGRAEELKNLLLQLGSKRFGAAPPAVEAVLRAIPERERLERIADRLLDATGWDDLLATL
jgi:hypothetical protein